MAVVIASNAGLALRSLARSPVRTFLVLQGVAWAVGIAVFPAAILEGSRDAAVRSAEVLGTGRISLAAEPGGRPLRRDDVASLRGGLPGWAPFRVDGFAVHEDATAGVEGGVAGAAAVVVGTGVDGARVRDQSVGTGRYLEERDFAPGAEPVAVLEPALARELFPREEGLGQTVTLAAGAWTRRVRVVGVLADRPEEALRTDDMGFELDHGLRPLAERMLTAVGVVTADDGWKRSERAVHVPHDAAADGGDGGVVDWIVVRCRPQETPGLTDAVRAALVARGAAPVAYTNLLWPFLASEHVEEFMRLKDALALACLVMGGVVIANVMLLTLLERTGEIAVRRVEGATRRDIALQFLAEAGVQGAVGAVLGLPLGMLLAWGRVALEPHRTLDFAFPAGTAALACLVAVAACVVAGILPAARAARLDPAAALREP
jgi:putative ABC transport system permease protein